MRVCTERKESPPDARAASCQSIAAPEVDTFDTCDSSVDTLRLLRADRTLCSDWTEFVDHIRSRVSLGGVGPLMPCMAAIVTCVVPGASEGRCCGTHTKRRRGSVSKKCGATRAGPRPLWRDAWTGVFEHCTDQLTPT